jgi:hypothetical protein
MSTSIENIKNYTIKSTKKIAATEKVRQGGEEVHAEALRRGGTKEDSGVKKEQS